MLKVLKSVSTIYNKQTNESPALLLENTTRNMSKQGWHDLIQ